MCSELHFDSGNFVLNSDAVRHEKTPEGYLRVYARVARVGDLVYRNDAGEERVEYIEPADLFDKKSINTLKMKPISIEHPGYLDAGNTLQHLKGVTGNLAVIDGDFLGIVATIYDRDTIDKIERGELREVSCSYYCDTERQPDGRYRQLNRRYNHLALTKDGRAGAEVSLHMDSSLSEHVWIQKDMNTNTIEINGQRFPADVVLRAVADAISQRSDTKVEEIEETEEDYAEEAEIKEDAMSLANDNAVLRATNSELKTNLEQALALLEEAKNTMIEASMLDELLNTWEKCRSIVESGYQNGSIRINGVTYDSNSRCFQFEGVDPLKLKQGVLEGKGVKLKNDSADAIDGAFDTFIANYVEVNPIEVADRYVRNDSCTVSSAEQARQERIKKIRERGRK